MHLIRDEDYFKLYLNGRVLIIEMINTEAVPSINYHALTEAFAAAQQLIVERDLRTTGWCILYDFSALAAYEVTAAMAFTTFFRWARNNGRLKSAHVFPASKQASEVSLIKRVVVSLISQFSRDNNDYYTASNRVEALRWFSTVLAQDVAASISE